MGGSPQNSLQQHPVLPRTDPKPDRRPPEWPRVGQFTPRDGGGDGAARRDAEECVEVSSLDISSDSRETALLL